MRSISVWATRKEQIAAGSTRLSKTPVEHTSIQLADAGNLSPKARGKQRVGAPLVREASKQSFIGDASTLMVKLRRAAPDQAFGMTETTDYSGINGLCNIVKAFVEAVVD